MQSSTLTGSSILGHSGAASRLVRRLLLGTWAGNYKSGRECRRFEPCVVLTTLSSSLRDVGTLDISRHTRGLRVTCHQLLRSSHLHVYSCALRKPMHRGSRLHNGCCRLWKVKVAHPGLLRERLCLSSIWQIPGYSCPPTS